MWIIAFTSTVFIVLSCHLCSLSWLLILGLVTFVSHWSTFTTCMLNMWSKTLYILLELRSGKSLSILFMVHYRARGSPAYFIFGFEHFCHSYSCIDEKVKLQWLHSKELCGRGLSTFKSYYMDHVSHAWLRLLQGLLYQVCMCPFMSWFKRSLLWGLMFSWKCKLSCWLFFGKWIVLLTWYSCKFLRRCELFNTSLDQYVRSIA